MITHGKAMCTNILFKVGVVLNLIQIFFCMSGLHTCPIYEHTEVHDNFIRHQSVPLSLRTASTVVCLGFGGG